MARPVPPSGGPLTPAVHHRRTGRAATLGLLLLLGACALAAAQAAPSPRTEAPLAVMPYPSSVVRGSGEFPIDSHFGVALQGYQEPRLERAKQRFLQNLSRQTGIPLWREAQFNQPQLFINTKGPSAPVQQLDEDESYHLVITPSGIHLDAPNPLGILHGLQTILQLVRITPQGFSVPAVTIDDRPRFPWRGLMIDVSRHFMPLDVLRRNLDGMEAVKLNVFHWHLSDDQGFRAQSQRFPLLTGEGSDGLFYTRQEIRDLIEYARDRGIRVVPEFDMPGHSTSWFVGYPQLASAPGPYQIDREWGISNHAMDPTRESTYRFLAAFIREMSELFPDRYLHIGGDECNGKDWDANPQIQAFMRAHGLKDNAALQAYFTARVQKLVAKRGKIMEGWDEVLQPNTPQDVVIQSWRGPESLAAAARQGNRALLSTGYYIDLNQTAAEHYAVDPLPAALTSGPSALSAAQQKLILGGEATMWSEYVDPGNIDSRIWPRTAAIAERLWSPADVTDIPAMYARLSIVSQKLEYLSLQHNSSYPQMLRRMTGETDPLPLHVLGDILQPPLGYQREKFGPYNTFTPLNRMPDAVHPESDVAREFQGLVDALLSGHAKPRDWVQTRRWLLLWRDNDARLEPLLPRSDLTEELIPVSLRLHQVSEIGLEALRYLRDGQAAPEEWRAQQTAFLEKAAETQAALRDMAAPQVLRLVRATAGPLPGNGAPSPSPGQAP